MIQDHRVNGDPATIILQSFGIKSKDFSHFPFFLTPLPPAAFSQKYVHYHEQNVHDGFL